jgi:predicted RNA-binding Zn-ribbon protein involved in translation (DUF1610 family)
METSLPSSTISCTQCGGELHPEQGQMFFTCPYCSATVYLDKSRVVFHWYLAPTLDEAKARASLARWMAGNETVKDLDQKARLTGAAFEYFPVWYFKHQLPGGKEDILLEPAAATSISEIRRVRLPGGDLRKYDSGLDAQAQPPSVPLQTALGWLADRQVPQQEIAEQALVHIPMYTFKYVYQNRPYAAVVEAATGGVFANIFPAKAEAPYLMVGGLAAIVFLCLATFPVIGAAANGGSGAGVGLLACAGLGIVAAPVLFALAAWVAAKI